MLEGHILAIAIIMLHRTSNTGDDMVRVQMCSFIVRSNAQLWKHVLSSKGSECRLPLLVTNSFQMLTNSAQRLGKVTE